MLLANETVATHLEAQRRSGALPRPRGARPAEGRASSRSSSPASATAWRRRRTARPAAALPEARRAACAARPRRSPIAFLMLRTMQKARYDAGEPRPLRAGGAELHALHVADPALSRISSCTGCCARRGTARLDATSARGAGPRTCRRSPATRPRWSAAPTTPSASCVQWKKVRFMADKVGDEFDGYITGVARVRAVRRARSSTSSKAWCTCRRMADDYYRFVEAAHTLRGENTQQGLPARRQGARPGRPRRHGTRVRSISAWWRSSTRVRRRASAGRGRSKAQPTRSAKRQREAERPRDGQATARQRAAAPSAAA